MTFFSIPANNQYILTDAASQQYGRCLGNFQFEFKDAQTPSVAINIADYTVSEIENVINSFGYTLAQSNGSNTNIIEQYGSEWAFIAAECIFETHHANVG